MSGLPSTPSEENWTALHWYQSLLLLTTYLAGDASESDSGDESGRDEDDVEPEESPKGESENDDDKLDDSKYRKKVDDIKAKFAECFRILQETNPTQILPVYANAKQGPPVQPQTEEPRAR